MKRYISVIIVVLIALTLSACMCEHEWAEANCVDPQTCTKCNTMEGTALGHEWLDADCLNPKRCNICGEVDGESLGHQWQAATCKTAKICTVCKEKDGKPLGHTYEVIEVLQEATCSAYGKTLQKCTVCEDTEEKLEQPVEHDFQTTTSRCIIKTTCKNCDYKTEREEHKEWYFPSNNYINTCQISTRSFSGTLACKGCGSIQEGKLKCTEEEFEKIFCSWLYYGNYDDIARYPEDNTNFVMKFKGYILQDCGDNLYRMSTSGRYDDIIMVEFVGKTKGRILEDDYVTVFGEPNLLYTYTSTMGAKITIPKFTAYYIHFN